MMIRLNNSNQSGSNRLRFTCFGSNDNGKNKEETAGAGDNTYQHAIEATMSFRHKEREQIDSQHCVDSNEYQNEQNQGQVPDNLAAFLAHDLLCELVGQIYQEEQIDNYVDCAGRHANVHPHCLHHTKEWYLKAE